MRQMHDFDPNYLRYIASEAWKVKREVYYHKHGRYCKACGATKEIFVHHMSYEHLGREPMVDLVSLCGQCHKEVHRQHRATGRHKDLRYVTMSYIKQKRRKK